MHVQACLGARKYGESSFHHCGGRARLRKKEFLRLWRCCEARLGLFKYQERSRKQCSSLCRC